MFILHALTCQPLLVHVPQGTAKLQAVKLFSFSKITYFFLYIKLSYENSVTYEHFWFFQVLKLWQPVTLLPLEAQGYVLHFWKPTIYICLEPECQGDCRVLKVCQVMLKSWGLLNKLLYASDLLCTPLYIPSGWHLLYSWH